MQATPQSVKFISPGQRLIWLVAAAIDLYALSLVLLLAANLFAGERFNVIAIANNLLHLPLLLSPLVLILALPLRRFRAVVLLLVSFGFTVSHYLPNFLPRAAHTPEGTVISLYTHNILARFEPDTTYAAEIEIIRNADADIVLIQEIGFSSAAEFAARLGDIYPHRALHPQPWANSGQGIFSKYPVIEDEFWHVDADIHLGHQRAVIDVDGTPIIVYNVHPLHPGMVNLDVSKRTEDVQTILERVAADPPDMPAVIAGDLNLTDLTRDYRSLRRLGFEDAHREVGRGFGFTFPATDPLQFLRLDYVLYNAYWTPLTSEVIRQAGQSDHYPLLVTLELNAP